MPVTWDNLSEDQVEDLIAVLLGHLYPDVERIDGAGGDGGRDLHYRSAQAYDIWQIKSFTGRMTASRRQQVKRSLQRAAQHGPSSWSLLVPINPTPREDEWFRELTGPVGFPAVWRGKTWLDTELSKRPHIVRYFRSGGHQEAVELLTQMAQEQAALAGGVPDALDRLDALVKLANELDAHYRFALASDGATRSVTVITRYADAVKDRPIGGTIRFRAPRNDDERERFDRLREAIDFGGGFTIGPDLLESMSLDLPAGLGGVFEGGTVEMRPADRENWSLEVRAVVQDASGRALATLPVTFTERSRGLRGLTASGTDLTGVITVVLKVDLEDRRFDLTFHTRMAPGTLPGEVLTPVVFLSNLAAGHSVTLTRRDTGENLLGSLPISGLPPIDRSTPEVFRALDRIQQHTGVYFPVPDELTTDDLREIRLASRLLTEAGVEQSFSRLSIGLDVKPDGAQALRERIEQGGPAQWRLVAGMSVSISGNSLELGTVEIYLPSARVENVDKVLAALQQEATSHVILKLVPGDSAVQRISLVPS
jgi:hypothetical protein